MHTLLNEPIQKLSNLSHLGTDFSIFSESLTVLCFCLFKQEKNSQLRSNFYDFRHSVSSNVEKETICAKRVFANESIHNKEVYENCINSYILHIISSSIPTTTAILQDDPYPGIDQPLLDYSTLNVFMIVLYSLTVLISIFGKYDFC